MSTVELTAKIKELREWEQIKADAEAAAEEIKDLIKGIMGEDEELAAGDYRVTWKHVTSNRFDSTSFKATHAELYNQYVKPSTSRRFIVNNVA